MNKKLKLHQYFQNNTMAALAKKTGLQEVSLWHWAKFQRPIPPANMYRIEIGTEGAVDAVTLYNEFKKHFPEREKKLMRDYQAMKHIHG